MNASSATAGVFAALLLAATPVLSAALAGDRYDEEYNSVEYEEETYAGDDIYEGEPPPRHTSYKDDPVQTGGSVKDGYPVPMPPPDDDYADAPPPAKRYGASPPRHLPPKRFACLESWEIERTLARDGWTRIHALSTRRGVTRIRARRYDSGRPFVLRVDRCSGELISARPSLRVFGVRDYGTWRPRRWAGRWHD